VATFVVVVAVVVVVLGIGSAVAQLTRRW